MKSFTLPAALVAVCVTAFAVAQPAPSPEEQAVRAAATEFLTAVRDGNQEAALNLYAGEGADRTLIENFVKLPPIIENFRAALIDKFGPNAATELPVGDMNLQQQIAQINRAPVTVEGDRAKISIPGNPGGMSFTRSGGNWKLQSLTGDAELSGLMSQMLSGVSGVMQTATTDIQGGKYATIADAKTALEAQTKAVMTPIIPRMMEIMMKKQVPAGGATTRPSGSN
ncbi:MAG TPA: hypothetical protein VGB55_09030 [Tepidisphaeraceae bacterium]